jgi:hypothetical protein
LSHGFYIFPFYNKWGKLYPPPLSNSLATLGHNLHPEHFSTLGECIRGASVYFRSAGSPLTRPQSVRGDTIMKVRAVSGKIASMTYFPHMVICLTIVDCQQDLLLSGCCT